MAIEWVFQFFVGFFAIFIFFAIKEMIKNRQGKLHLLKRDIMNEYYDKDKLKDFLKMKLKDTYVDNLEVDFDHYVIKTVLNDLSELESTEKYKRYLDFLPKEKVAEVEAANKDSADQIFGEYIENDMYYLRLTQFLKGTTYRKIKTYLPDLSQSTKLIIDLRNNSGGIFEELRKVLEIFIPQRRLLYQLNGSGKEKKVYSKTSNCLIFEEIVLLTNNRTASTAELFVLALKSNVENVTIIGEPTYGKNVSYSIRKFPDKSGMVIINSIMEGPNNLPINIQGIAPDIIMEDEGESSNPSHLIEKAVNYLKTKDISANQKLNRNKDNSRKVR